MKRSHIIDLSNEDYHASPAISKSGLDAVSKSIDHYRAYKAKATKVTPAMIFGQRVHEITLEPDTFHDRFTVKPADLDGRTKEGKAWKAEAADRGLPIIDAAELEELETIASAVHNHPIAGPIIRSEGWIESSFFWTDPEYGVDCRCRPDILTTDGLYIDLKTTRDASPEAFATSAARYRYDVQGAFYSRGIESVLELEVQEFLIVAVEKAPPYAVAVYRLPPVFLSIGVERMHRDLERFRDYLEDPDQWTGYPLEVLDLHPPRWL